MRDSFSPSFSYKDYSDANAWFRHDIGSAHVDPVTKMLLEASFVEHDADKHASNLKHLPILARIGVSVQRLII